MVRSSFASFLASRAADPCISTTAIRSATSTENFYARNSPASLMANLCGLTLMRVRELIRPGGKRWRL